MIECLSSWFAGHPSSPQAWLTEAAAPTGVPESSVVPSTKPGKPAVRKRNRDSSMKNLQRSSCGSYHARVCFDMVHVMTKDSDLPTAVESLMFLTSIKQKMLDIGTETFEERFKEALASSSKEHRKSLDEMGLRYRVQVSACSFIGNNSVRLVCVQVLSPKLHRSYFICRCTYHIYMLRPPPPDLPFLRGSSRRVSFLQQVLHQQQPNTIRCNIVTVIAAQIPLINLYNHHSYFDMTI